jgi:lipopolysaccharide/colanic/teichoic acid biosynthesis glycosyltransferase
MMLCKWEQLPSVMQTTEVRKYYDILKQKQHSLFFKRLFDIVVSLLLLILFSPLFLILAIAIKLDSKGSVFYRQTRITQYGRAYRIFKFRTMTQDADKGSLLTLGNDRRITRVGKFIRRCRLDEISQLLDVLRGTMTFVGTRPEVPKYVDLYKPEMLATLLLPAGITSEASIVFKNEAEILEAAANPDKAYMDIILPEKMTYNLQALTKFSLAYDIKILFWTACAILGIGSENISSPKPSGK